MSSFIVTDKAIVDFLIRKFDKKSYVAQSHKHQAEFDDAIQKILKSIDIDQLRDEHYVLSSKLRKKVINTVNKFFILSDGEIVDTITADTEKAFFLDTPRIIIISDTVVGNFLNEVDKIDVARHFPNHESALRIYVGHEKILRKNIYGVLIVPICSPIVVAGVKRNHSLDKENSLLGMHGSHFALAVTDTQKGIENNLNTWKDITLNKDEFSNTELIYFTQERMKKFRLGTDSTRRKYMAIHFSRKSSGGSISVIISYLDSSNNLLESDFHISGLATSGTFFDLGDLIPPPSPVSDKSF